MITPQLAAPRQAVDLRGAGRQVAKHAGGNTVAAFFEANKGAISAVLPQHMTADRMLKIALRCLRTTPKLMDCTLESLFGAVITCSQHGLEPNTPLGHVYLIPFENKRKQSVEVQVIVGYKGMIDLAMRSGKIESISSRTVCKNDHFEIDYGTDDRIIHKPMINGDRGPVIGFYAVAKLKGGGTQFEFMSKLEVDKIMRSTQSGGRYGPWHDNYDEMGKKTPIRRLFKYLPMSIEMANAYALDERADTGKTQALSSVLEGDFVVPAFDDDEDDTDHAIDCGPQTGEVIPHQQAIRPQGEDSELVHVPDQQESDPASIATTGRVRGRGRPTLFPGA